MDLRRQIISLLNFFVLVSLQTPKLLWPLDNNTCELEVMNKAIEPVLFCNHTFVIQDYSFPYVSMVLQEHIDVRIAYSTKFKNHYSFGGMFLLHDVYGVIFHYKSDVENIETMLSVENGTLKLYRNGVIPRKHFRNDDVVNLKTNTWIWITMAVGNYGYPHASVGKEHALIGIGSRKKVELPGNLRIGGSFDTLKPAFKGQLSCVGFFYGQKWPTYLSTQQLCNSTQWTEKDILVSTTSIGDHQAQTEQTTPIHVCRCRCKLARHTNWKVTDKEEIKRDIENTLLVDKRATSAFLNTKRSAPDDRITAKTVGFAGILFIVLPLAFIVMFDCVRI